MRTIEDRVHVMVHNLLQEAFVESNFTADVHGTSAVANGESSESDEEIQEIDEIGDVDSFDDNQSTGQLTQNKSPLCKASQEVLSLRFECKLDAISGSTSGSANVGKIDLNSSCIESAERSSRCPLNYQGCSKVFILKGLLTNCHDSRFNISKDNLLDRL